MSANADDRQWRPRPVVVRPAGDRTGRVVAVEAGVAVVAVLSLRGRTVRATLGGDLLGRIAQDPDAAPRPGDRVRLRWWADGPVTLERVVARPMA